MYYSHLRFFYQLHKVKNITINYNSISCDEIPYENRIFGTAIFSLHQTNSNHATTPQCAEYMWQHMSAGGFK